MKAFLSILDVFASRVTSLARSFLNEGFLIASG
jgi:hypothetical protein